MEWYYWLLISIAIFIFLIILIRCIFNGPRTKLNPQDLSDKTIIVTGANTGIGKVTAEELLKKGAKVILAARNEQKTNNVINSLPEEIKKNAAFIKLDLSDFASIKNFTEEFKSKYNKLDILINNAGGVFDKLVFYENIEQTTLTNTIGPICLTALLIDYLNASGNGKVINVSSYAHTYIKDQHIKYLLDSYESDNNNLRNNYQGWVVYCLSKLGNIYYSKFLQENFSGIKSVSLHPGVVNSDFFSVKRSENGCLKCLKICLYPFALLFFKNNEMGAQTQLHCAYMEYNEMNSGDYFHDCKYWKLGDIPESKEIRNKFMDFYKKMVYRNWDNPPEEIKRHFDMVKDEVNQVKVY